jgi:hypothetical protein
LRETGAGYGVGHDHTKLNNQTCLRRYLFVAIDRATRWVSVHIYGDMTDKSSVDFLCRLKLASPIKINKILTDNGARCTPMSLPIASAVLSRAPIILISDFGTLSMRQS